MQKKKTVKKDSKKKKFLFIDLELFANNVVSGKKFALVLFFCPFEKTPSRCA